MKSFGPGIGPGASWPGDHQHDPPNHPSEDEPIYNVRWYATAEARPVVLHDCLGGGTVRTQLPCPKWQVVNAEGRTGLRVEPSFHCTACGCHLFLGPDQYDDSEASDA